MSYKHKRLILGIIIVTWGIVAAFVLLNTAKQLPEKQFILKNIAANTPAWSYISCSITTGIFASFELIPETYSAKFMITYASIQLFIYTVIAQITGLICFRKPGEKKKKES